MQRQIWAQSCRRASTGRSRAAYLGGQNGREEADHESRKADESDRGRVDLNGQVLQVVEDDIQAIDAENLAHEQSDAEAKGETPGCSEGPDDEPESG